MVGLVLRLQRENLATFEPDNLRQKANKNCLFNEYKLHAWNVLIVPRYCVAFHSLLVYYSFKLLQ